MLEFFFMFFFFFSCKQYSKMKDAAKGTLEVETQIYQKRNWSVSQ